jgi:hypothetical protein
MKLSFDVFCLEVLARFEKHFGGEWKLDELTRVNEHLTTLLKLPDELEGLYVSPNIYLNDWYIKYCRMNPDEENEIYEAMFRFWEDACGQEDYIVGVMSQFIETPSLLLDKVIFHLIGKERNATLLERVPHRDFLDMAIIYRVVVSSREDGYLESLLVTDDLMERFGWSEEMLYEHSKVNTPKMFPAVIVSMLDYFQGYGDFAPVEDYDVKSHSFDDFIPMFTVTNNGMGSVLFNRYGAASMLYTDVLKLLADQCDDDLLLIPSSIHEFIMIPLNYTDGRTAEFRDMVGEVNSNVLDPREALTDSVYIYDRRKAELVIA